MPRRADPHGRSGYARWQYDLLCWHVEQRFPGRIDRATIEQLVAEVLLRSKAYASSYAGSDLPAGLKADANRAALMWLKSQGKISACSLEYDDLFAETVFGGRFDAAALHRGVQAMVRDRRVVEVQIITRYLDMTDLNGTAPTFEQVARRLRINGRPVTAGQVGDAILDFYKLLDQTVTL